MTVYQWSLSKPPKHIWDLSPTAKSLSHKWLRECNTQSICSLVTSFHSESCRAASMAVMKTVQESFSFMSISESCLIIFDHLPCDCSDVTGWNSPAGPRRHLLAFVSTQCSQHHPWPRWTHCDFGVLRPDKHTHGTIPHAPSPSLVWQALSTVLQ